MLLLKLFTAGSSPEDSLPIDVSFMREIWSPDAEIRNLKEFRTLNVLSKVNQYSILKACTYIMKGKSPLLIRNIH